MNKDCDDIEFKPVDRLISQKSRNFIYDLFVKNLTIKEESKTINFQEFPLIVQCNILSKLTHEDFVQVFLFSELRLLYCKHHYTERIYEERCKNWFPSHFIKFKPKEMKWKEFYARINSLLNKIDCCYSRLIINSKLIRKNKLIELQIINSYENDYNMDAQSDLIRRMYLNTAKKYGHTEIIEWMKSLEKVYKVSQNREYEYYEEQNHAQSGINTINIIDPFYTPSSVTQIVGRINRFPSINKIYQQGLNNREIQHQRQLILNPVHMPITIHQTIDRISRNNRNNRNLTHLNIKDNIIHASVAQTTKTKLKLNTKGKVVTSELDKSLEADKCDELSKSSKTNNLIEDVD